MCKKILQNNYTKNVNISVQWMQFPMLYIDFRPGQTCHSKDAEVACSIGTGELGWQYGTGLKSHGTVTNWCTGRELPVNCMTVISARWRSNMPFQRWGKCIFRWPVLGRYRVGMNCYITECTGNSISWRQDTVEKASTQQRAGPRASGWATLENGKEMLMAIRVGVDMLQFCSVSNSLSHTKLSNKVRGIFC